VVKYHDNCDNEDINAIIKKKSLSHILEYELQPKMGFRIPQIPPSKEKKTAQA